VSGVADGYSFVAWSRRGLAAAIPSQGADDGHATLPVTLTVRKRVTETESETEPVGKTLRFYGPGDVLQIDSRQIIRREPRPAATDFEPNYFPLIEFDAPEFPWLFSPEPRAPRLRPWLVLVVVPRDAAQIMVDPRRPLPWLTMVPAVARDELPDLAESWAWAHAQLLGTPPNPADPLGEAPELTLSRLMCPRRLLPQTAYLACLVPAYRAGAQAGLGEPVDADSLPAWPPPEGWSGTSFELPVYDHWEFTTAVVGDFELLVRRLRPSPLGPDIGALPLDIGNPGPEFDDLHLPRPTELPLEGALTSPELPEHAWPAEVEEDFKGRLEDLIELPPGVDETVLRPPIYGAFQAGLEGVLPESGAPQAWLRDLNLDPSWRVAASLGTLVVQRLQEQLVASAWDQAGELERANAMLRQSQLARTTAAAVRDKHLNGQEAARDGELIGLAATATVRLTAPLHGRVKLTAAGQPPAARQTLQGSVRKSVFPEPAVSPPFRRVLRPAGPLARRLPVSPERATSALTHDLADGAVHIPVRPARGGADFDEVGGPRFRHLRDNLADGAGWLKVADPESGFYQGADPYAGDPRAAGPVTGAEAEPAESTAGVATRALLASDGGDGGWDIDEEGRRADRLRGINDRFKLATDFLLQHLPATVGEDDDTRPNLALDEVAHGLVRRGGALEPDDTVAREVLTLVPQAPQGAAGRDPLRPRAAAPRFPQAMSGPLVSVDAEMLLPGIDRIGADSVGVLVGNPRFIEAYMAGINHELSREFLWRGLPTDLAATFADRFWDTRGSVGTGGVQIPPILGWEGGLGSNATGVGGGEMLVVIVRGRVLHRYPHTAFYMARTVLRADDGGNLVPAPGPEEHYPAFRGTIDPDVTYLGFEVPIEEARGDDGGPGWFFVIQEQPAAPRFGLDDREDAQENEPPSSWTQLDWADVFPAGTDLSKVRHATVAGPLASPDPVILPVLDGRAEPEATWGADAAQMAAITYQRPMRVAIQASAALPEAEE
jgi:hypothetical protein